MVINVLRQKALRSKAQFLLAVACVIMYALAAAHWALVVPWRDLGLAGLSSLELQLNNQVGDCTFASLLLINVRLDHDAVGIMTDPT